jgi:hypothetical protein
MVNFRERTRFASLVAIGLTLLVSGVVTGAAGGNFILGQANSAGTSNTSLTTSSTGNALLVTQNGTGTAIRGSTGSGSGIAGFFTSGSGSGVSGVVANQNSYGIYAANDSATGGAGAAMRVNGKANRGIVVTSDGDTAIEAQTDSGTGLEVTSASGSGIFATATGFAVALSADGSDALFGILATGSTLTGTPAIVGTSAFDQGIGVSGTSSDGTGVEGVGEGAGVIDFDCTDTCYDNPGGAFTGNIGVIGQTDGIGPEGYSRGVVGIASGSGFFGLFSQGDAYVAGNLQVTGTCTGCTAAALAQNTSGQTIRQGDAVTAVGVTTGDDGSIVIQVAKAKKGDAILGIADVSMSLSAEKITTKAISRKAYRIDEVQGTTTSKSATVTAKDRKWTTGKTSSADGSFLRVITSGMFAYDGATPASAAAGDLVAVGDSTGKVAKASGDVAKGASVGKYLGKLKDGRVVLQVNPS